MLTFIRNHKLSIYIFFLILIGGFLRFYNLNWGSPFYFHPDERNIASSVLNINFPNQINPHFFAYGSFPIYLISFTAYFSNLITKSQLIFEQAIIISRFYSAFLSVLLIPSIYFVGATLVNKRVGILAATFCTLSVGLVQFSHFGTFEMWLTFLGLWLFYFSSKLIRDLNLKNIILIGIISGLLMATKISSLPLFIIPVIAIILNLSAKIKTQKMYLFLSKLFFKTSLLISVSFIIFVIFSPYVFLDSKSFLSSMQYESSVALGALHVFYTGEFFNSIPIIFQFSKIYPFLLNPILTIIFIPSFFYLSYKGLKTRNPQYLILNTCYLILFFSQAFLFTKWTRYIVPTLPFMFIIISIFLNDLLKKSALSIKYSVLGILISFSVIFSASYFTTAFLKPDTRIEASIFAKENIPIDSYVLSEVYDMGIVPFNPYLHNITLFNFYDLDQISDIKKAELDNLLSQSKYIILPSQRILKTRLLNKDKFPIGNKFYKGLVDGKLYYEKVYETSCDIFCKIIYLGGPIFALEQTVNVFDRPTVFMFKKYD